MALKEELEILRGEPIDVFSGELVDIPCIETYDAEKLCKRPVVSVHMITYNHEPYIRHAIEGVIKQKTDFEFELVIGEDCSKDKTREICFEYQEKYPDKIRVLWWHENVSRFGGNGRRVTAHCRGKFIAFCEGDDWWTDEHKLQHQVDAFREHPSAGLCFTQSEVFNEITGNTQLWSGDVFPEGLIPGHAFFMWLGFGKRRVARKLGSESFIMTATAMVRRDFYKLAMQKYDIFRWNLMVGDSTLWLGVSSFADVIFLRKCTSVYRQNNTGVTQRAKSKVSRDGLIVRMYYAVKTLGTTLDEALWHLRNIYAQIFFCYVSEQEDPMIRKDLVNHILVNSRLRRLFHLWRYYLLLLMMRIGLRTPFFRLWGSRFVLQLPMRQDKTDVFNKFYDKIDYV